MQGRTLPNPVNLSMMNKHIIFPRFCVRAWALLALLVPSVLCGQLYLSSGHVDLNVVFAAEPSVSRAQGFGLYAHHVSTLSGGAIRNEPIDHTVLYVPDNGGKYAQAGGLLTFLGQTGQDVWLVPQNAPPATVPFLGFGGYGLSGTEGIPSTELNDFDPIPELTGTNSVPAVRVRFLSALTPAGADFALWQTGSGGAVTLFFSNRPNTTAPQMFGLRRGQHIHFNWGFSRPGYYRIRLRVEGSRAGVPVPAGDFAVDFSVSTLPLYEQWRRAGARFTEAERANRTIGGPLADPDGDGRANIFEYAWSAEPRMADAAPTAPVLSLVPGTGGVLPTLGFNRLADPLLVYRVESTTDFSAWSSLWTSAGAANLAGPVSVDAPTTLSVAEPRRFLRLRLSLVE